MDNQRTLRLADLVEACASALAASRCDYCVGWWTAVLKTLARKMREGDPIESDFLERHGPGRSERHGPRCQLHTQNAKTLLVR